MFSILKKAVNKGIVTKRDLFGKDSYTARTRGAVRIDHNCSKCGLCIDGCPTNAIFSLNNVMYVDNGKCIFCGKCVNLCPEAAVRNTSQYKLAELERNNLVVSAENIETLKKDLNKKISKIFSRSLHIRHLDSGSCNGCDWEMVAMTNPVYDLQRLGVDIVASPRHADILLATGPVSKNLEQAVRLTYESVPRPRLVMAVGTCAIDGGVFRGSEFVLNGVDKVIPVDVYVPGCPPKPQAIMHGLLKLLDKYSG